MTLDRTPPTLSVQLVAVLAAVAALPLLLGGAVAGLGLLGAVGLVGGTRSGRRPLVTGGAAALALAALLAGLVGVDPVAVLVSVAATLVAWDVGEHAVGLAEQVGQATTRRSELAHAGASGLLAATVGTLGALVYFLGDTVRPTLVVVLLVLGAVLVVAALD